MIRRVTVFKADPVNIEMALLEAMEAGQL